MQARTNDGIIGNLRSFVRCDSCLCEIVEIDGYEDNALGNTVITDDGQRVDLCVRCVTTGFVITLGGQIVYLIPLAGDAAGSNDGGGEVTPSHA